MKLQFQRGQDIIFVDKPAGFSTHSPDLGKTGLCEIYEQALGQKLYVVHRLDKTTTGALVFATTPEKARQLTEQFQNKLIQKKYLLVTDGVSTKSEYLAFSQIEKRGNAMINTPCEASEANAETLFRRVRRSPFYEIWEAYPKTGKSHQIRLHAKQIGLPILGDTLYGGSACAHLCLHANELQLPQEKSWITSPPLFFDRPGLLRDPELTAWLSEADRRERLYHFLQSPDESLRLIHTPELRADIFGSQIYFYLYRDLAPDRQMLERCEFLAALLKKSWLLRQMNNRGDDPNLKKIWQGDTWQAQWQAAENGIKYELRSEAGQSPGLFLDQRGNRLLVRKKSTQKKVLNLFAYTCGFSLNAAVGGAQEITSVDLSQGFLNWGKQSFYLNGLEASTYEFFVQETLLFLRGAQKRGRQFDLIICDPPSFGRFKKEVFRLEKVLPDLLTLCWQCLSAQGELLFSSNFEKWSEEEFVQKIRRILPQAKFEKMGTADTWDYELPNETKLMKAFWLKKTR